MNAVRAPWRRCAEPLLLAVLTVAGLIASLIGNGAAQNLGVAAVALPLLAIFRYVIRSMRQPSSFHSSEEPS